MPKPNWTKEDIDVLKSLWGKLSTRKIALKLNRSRNSIIGKANVLSLEKLAIVNKKTHPVNVRVNGRVELKTPGLPFVRIGTD